MQLCSPDEQGASGVALRRPGGRWLRGSGGCEGASGAGEADGWGCRGWGCSMGGREVLASASEPSKQKNVVLQRATGCHEQGVPGTAAAMACC